MTAILPGDGLGCRLGAHHGACMTAIVDREALNPLTTGETIGISSPYTCIFLKVFFFPVMLPEFKDKVWGGGDLSKPFEYGQHAVPARRVVVDFVDTTS